MKLEEFDKWAQSRDILNYTLLYNSHKAFFVRLDSFIKDNQNIVWSTQEERLKAIENDAAYSLILNDTHFCGFSLESVLKAAVQHYEQINNARYNENELVDKIGDKVAKKICDLIKEEILSEIKKGSR